MKTSSVLGKRLADAAITELIDTTKPAVKKKPKPLPPEECPSNDSGRLTDEEDSAEALLQPVSRATRSAAKR